MTTYSCTFHVEKTNNPGFDNYPWEYVEVAGKLENGNITEDFETDSDGDVTVKWYSNQDIEYIYVDGDIYSGPSYDGPFKDGHHYRIVVDD